MPASWTSADRWAWEQIRQQDKDGNFQPIDFNNKLDCGNNFNPKDEDKEGREEKCRDVSFNFLQDILMRPRWRDAVPAAGVQFEHARIRGGDVDLKSARLLRPISIKNSRFFRGINLSHAQTDFLIDLGGSQVDGPFEAEGLNSKSDLLLKSVDFKKKANLNRANISGEVSMDSASFVGTLMGDEMKSDASLILTGAVSNSEEGAHFNLAKIKGFVILDGSTFAGPFKADSLTVEGDLWIKNGAQFKNLVMTFAHVGGNLDLTVCPGTS